MSDKNPSWTAWAIMVAAIVLIAIAFSRKSGVDRAVSERTPTRPTSVANILEELPDIAVDELVEAGWLTRSPVGEDPLLKDRMIEISIGKRGKPFVFVMAHLAGKFERTYKIALGNFGQ